MNGYFKSLAWFKLIIFQSDLLNQTEIILITAQAQNTRKKILFRGIWLCMGEGREVHRHGE
jgi:hypothetical protein